MFDVLNYFIGYCQNPIALYWKYCWKHSTSKQTPAQAAKLSDHVWTVQELIDTVSKPEPCTI